MHLEVIRDSARMLQFAPEWSAFAKSQPHITPFQFPEWLIPWWSHFGSGTPQVFVFREQECIGVLPCFLHNWNGKRQMTLLGSGVSDYLDPLFASAYQAPIIGCLREHLEQSDDWDVCDWQDLSYNTPLDSLSAKAWALEKQEEVFCTEVQLRETFEHFWQERPRHLRRNVRRGVNNARQNGSLAFQMTGNADRHLLDALMRLHTARWSLQGEPGMIAANHLTEFLYDIARRFAEEGILRMFSLCYQGEIAAVILGFLYQRTLYGYLTGFDPTYKHLSLASVLLHNSLQECYRQGFRAWNFCRGNEPYKTEWGPQPMRRCRIVLQRKRS